MTATGVGTRLDTYIDIPLEIGVPHFISDDCGHVDDVGYEPNFTNFKLSLLAVICHRGKSLDAGHYVALVRGREDSHGHATQWLRFDDLAHQRIASVDIQKALKDECPYLLFYQVRPIDDDDDFSEQDGPPSYNEATTDASNGDLSRIGTNNDISEPAITTNVIPVSTTGSQETLTSTSNTDSDTPTKSTALTEATSADLVHVTSDPEPHTNTTEPPVRAVEVEADEGVKPRTIDLAGLTAPITSRSKQSLDIPRGRSSFQGSAHRHSLSIEEVKKDRFSVPVTPEDNRTSWMQSMGNSRRNSLAKVWKPRSRPGSQTGEGRISMNFIRTMISKDKLHEMNASKDEPHTQASTTHFDKILEKPREKESESKTDIPRRNKSLRHKKDKGKRSSSIGRMLDMNNEGTHAGKSKKTPDRECIVM